jgi:membrane protease YdiL (CAAX protease family)
VGIPVAINIYGRFNLFVGIFFNSLVIGPFEEELAMRGFAYPIFKNRYGIADGIIICSIIFSLLHVLTYYTILSISGFSLLGSAIYFLNYMLFGVFYNIILEIEGDLKWCVFFHFLSALFIISILIVG